MLYNVLYQKLFLNLPTTMKGQVDRAGPVVLAGGAAALGPQMAGPPVMYACSVCVLVCVRRTVVCIYEGSNCDMLSAQRKANNLRPTHLPFFLAKPPRGTPVCSVVLHKKKETLVRLLGSSSALRVTASLQYARRHNRTQIADPLAPSPSAD